MFGIVSETWKTRCRTVCYLAVLALFFFLPLHSDPSISIVLSALLGLLATDKPYLPSGLSLCALAAFLGYGLVAFIASAHSMETLSKYPIVVLWACAIVAGMLFSRLYPDHQYNFFLATALAILLSLGIAAVQGFGASQFWHDGRLKLLAVHPSRLALYCAVTLLFCLHSAVMARHAKGKVFFLIIAAAMAFCLYLTNTRGVILIVPIGILCLVPSLPVAYRKPFLAAFLIMCTFAGAFLWITKDTPLSKRVVSAITSPADDATFRSRLPIWEAAWEVFKEKPLIGHGVKSYSGLHKEYLTAHKAEWDVKYAGSYEQSAKNAHNIILGRLVESGTWGALFFMLFYGVVTVAAFRLSLQQRWIAAFFVFYLGIGMFDDTLFRRNDAFVFFLAGTVLGFVVPQKILTVADE